MKLLTCFFLVVFLASPAFAQDPQVSRNAPQDSPLKGDASNLSVLNAAIAPSVAEARRSFPAARSRFMHGLPSGQSFFITARLHDGSGNIEQAFIAVNKIDGGIIYGKIWSQIEFVHGYKLGDSYHLPESDMLDWLITHPDGSEEGNFVGKFLDSYRGNGT